MPWKCPACSTLIRSQLLTAGHETPVAGKVYVCSVCRLELVLSNDGTHMVVTPIHRGDDKREST
jgi:hypothetical protein